MDVIVLEGQYIGSGETGRSTAHLMSYFDDHYQVIEQIHETTTSREVAQSY